MKRIEEFLQNFDAGRVLDVATGQGNFIPFVLESRSYEEIIAIDNSKVYGKIIEKQFSANKVRFQVADAYNLPFVDEDFDTIALSNSIHHFEFPAQLLKELTRVLKSTGRIIINEMYADNLTPAQESHKMIHHISAERDRILGRFHADTYSKTELSKIMNSHFIQEQEIDYNYPVADVMDQERLEHILEICDTMLEQSKADPQLQTLISKFQSAKAYIQKHGYASASSLFFVGRKI